MLYVVTCRDTHPEAEGWDEYLADAASPEAAARRVVEDTVWPSCGDTYRLSVRPLPAVGPGGLACLVGGPADWYEYALAEDAESQDQATLTPIPPPAGEDD